MHPLLMHQIADERRRDLHRSLRPNVRTTPSLRTLISRRIRSSTTRWSTVPTPAADRITIRVCTADETWAVERLAALGATPLPEGPLLIAEVGGQVEVALPLRGGDPLANPFRPTGHLASLLELRREQLQQAA